MENLTVEKVYVSAKHLAIPQRQQKISPLKSTVCNFHAQASETVHRSATSVHNWEFPVKNSSAVQQKLDAILEEIS
ncbi:hypothetical protein [Massilia sp. TN1-12]|uniref:hypothetical protein n=1 Tax=Massilia paldalensis TaxID=3377675 RepID=UPI00384ADC56